MSLFNSSNTSNNHKKEKQLTNTAKIETTISGEVERIIYANEETGYYVLRMNLKGHYKPVTVVGNLATVNPGERLKVTGYWDRHPKYGEQFTVKSYVSLIPASATAIEKYLASDFIKGIGPVLAKRLVDYFAEDTLRIIDEEVERITEVEGIGGKRLEMIKNAWQDQKQIREVMLFLQSFGISSRHSVKIFKQYGNAAISILKSNPYKLAEDIYGIGFYTADQIARKMGLAEDSIFRIRAALRHILNQAADEGHVYLPKAELTQRTVQLLIKAVAPQAKEPADACCSADGSNDTNETNEAEVPFNNSLIYDALAEEFMEKRLVVEESESGNLLLKIDKLSDTNVTKDTNRVYLAAFHTAEKGSARFLKALLSAPVRQTSIGLDFLLPAIEEEMGIKLAAAQRQAIEMALKSKVLVITGGPGTGKTTIIRAIVSIYERLGKEVILAAPTGRAAKRLAQATGKEAKTLHRLLEFKPSMGGGESFFQVSTLDTDVVILDEVSMMDIIITYHLLKALLPKTVLILVGDMNQLPSVGPGQVLRDIIDSDVVPTIKLTEIFRQAQQSCIVRSAHLINKGDIPPWSWMSKGSSTDLFFVQKNEPEAVLETILQLCRENIPEHYHLDPINDLQVISPMHKGVVGVSNLNKSLQEIFNPAGSGKVELARAESILREGDKVMQLRNNYDKKVFNGDLGFITKIDLENKIITVKYEGGSTLHSIYSLVNYEFHELDEIMLAYATSVHKAQGSEFPAIVMPLLTQHYMLLQRNLLYTAITRAKQLAVLVGQKKAFYIAVKNDRVFSRYTALADWLAKGMNNNLI